MTEEAFSEAVSDTLINAAHNINIHHFSSIQQT